MSSNKAKRHVHKYHKINIGYATVWACALPDCNHYMPAHMTSMIPGKSSICWKCEEQHILDLSNMQNDKPICNNCSELIPKVTDALEHFGVK